MSKNMVSSHLNPSSPSTDSHLLSGPNWLDGVRAMTTPGRSSGVSFGWDCSRTRSDVLVNPKRAMEGVISLKMDQKYVKIHDSDCKDTQHSLRICVLASDDALVGL
jgi:hypothetical protein